MTSNKKYQLEDLKQFKIAVICGGNSNEREVSLTSGDGVYQALKSSSLNLDVHKIDPVEYDLLNLKRDGFQLAFNILHGRFGEDGILQAFLQVLGIKYTGCNVLSSALTLDKKLTKDVWIQNGVEVAPAITLSKKQIIEQQYNVQEIIDKLGLPLFVKPNREGSSVGVSKVKKADDLVTALEMSAKIDDFTIVEKFLDGKEYSVPVLNGKALTPIEIIVPAEFEFYNYESKYISNDTRYECPPNLNPEQIARMQYLAQRAAKVVNINSWCRVDVLSDSQGNFYALEVNTNPGMTSHSLFPMAAKLEDMSYQDLCLHLLLDALNEVESK